MRLELGFLSMNFFSANALCVISVFVPLAEMTFAEKSTAGASIVNESLEDALASFCVIALAEDAMFMERVSPLAIEVMFDVGRT